MYALSNELLVLGEEAADIAICTGKQSIQLTVVLSQRKVVGGGGFFCLVVCFFFVGHF